MKPKMTRNELVEKNDIWNAVLTVASECDPSTKDQVLKEAFIVVQYYSELESGGHESLLTWMESYIDEVGIDSYLAELIAILEKIGAQEYAYIVKKYGQEMWKLYIALEHNEIKEGDFYEVIEKADDAFHKLNRKLDDLLECYFIRIHTDLIDVVEE
ncbi:DMP19 family protein [Sporosarcina sp. CAU 1771]